DNFGVVREKLCSHFGRRVQPAFPLACRGDLLLTRIWPAAPPGLQKVLQQLGPNPGLQKIADSANKIACWDLVADRDLWSGADRTEHRGIDALGFGLPHCCFSLCGSTLA